MEGLLDCVDRSGEPLPDIVILSIMKQLLSLLEKSENAGVKVNPHNVFVLDDYEIRIFNTIETSDEFYEAPEIEHD